MTVSDSDLVGQATAFAQRLTATLQATLGRGVGQFRAVAVDRPGDARVSLHQEPRPGLVLSVRGVPLLLLVVSMRLQWDHAGRYLAVDESRYQLSAVGDREPLLRYEYVRRAEAIPAAHLQVHGHRDSLAAAMTRCGENSPRSRRRAGQGRGGFAIPRMQDLHLPLGGARFRPCLEDVLEMVVDEFGIDAEPGARESLAEGREVWRLDQLAAAIRDAPTRAAATLRALGYDVGPEPDDVGQHRTDRLRTL